MKMKIYRERRISGLELALPSLPINRIKGSSDNFDQHLILLHLRHCHFLVELQNINAPIFPIQPSLHFAWNSSHFSGLSLSG